MYKLLVKSFVKDYKNTKDSNVRKNYGTLASVFGLITNISLVIIKMIIGVLTSSISIIGDAINNTSDSVSSFISLFGFKMSSKPADKDHPYGHGRMEYLAGFIVSIIVCVLGIELIANSIDKIIHPKENVSLIVTTSLLLVISILIKVYQSLFYYKVSKTISSTTLKATSIDSRNDVIATSAVLIGMIISYFTGFNLDGYLGIIVGLLVFISGVKLVMESSSPLLGKAADGEFVLKIAEEIKQHDIVLGIHDLHVHSYGHFSIFVSCHVEVDSSLNLLDVHEAIDDIERECNEKFNIELVIHIDPILIGDPFTDELKEKTLKVLSSLPVPHSMHDFRVVKGSSRVNIIFDIVIPFDCKMKNVEIEKYIKEELEKIDENYNLILQIDKEYNAI